MRSKEEITDLCLTLALENIELRKAIIELLEDKSK